MRHVKVFETFIDLVPTHKIKVNKKKRNVFLICRTRNMIEVFWTKVPRMLGDHKIRFNNQKYSIKLIPKVRDEVVTLENDKRVICTKFGLIRTLFLTFYRQDRFCSQQGRWWHHCPVLYAPLRSTYWYSRMIAYLHDDGLVRYSENYIFICIVWGTIIHIIISQGCVSCSVSYIMRQDLREHKTTPSQTHTDDRYRQILYVYIMSIRYKKRKKKKIAIGYQ